MTVIHVIQQNTQETADLAEALREGGFNIDVTERPEEAATRMQVGDIILLDYSLVQHDLNTEIKGLHRWGQGEKHPSTTLIFFSGRKAEIRKLQDRDDVFRAIAKPVKHNDLLCLLKYCEDIKKLEWYIGEQEQKKITFFFLLTSMDIPAVVIDVNLRILFVNKAFQRYINGTAVKGEFCYNTNTAFRPLPCPDCPAQKIFNGFTNSRGLSSRVVDGKDVYFRETAVPLKAEDGKAYASLVYYEEDRFASVNVFDFQERIKTSLRFFLPHGFTRARYFEIERLPENHCVSGSQDRGLSPYRWLMRAEAQLGDDESDSFIGIQKPFNPGIEPIFKSTGGENFLIHETSAESLWSEVPMGNATNWVKIVIKQEETNIITGSYEEVPVALIALDRRTDHQNERWLGGAEKNIQSATSRITNEDLKFLKSHYPVIKKMILDTLRTRQQEKNLHDFKIIIDPANNLSRADNEKSALEIFVNTCIKLTHADGASLMRLSSTETSLEKITGHGELREVWPSEVHLDLALPCANLFSSYMVDETIKHIIHQDIHASDSTNCFHTLYEHIFSSNPSLKDDQKEKIKDAIKKTNTWACFVIEYKGKGIGTLSLLFKNKYAISNYSASLIETYITKAAPLLMLIRSREESLVRSI